MRTRCHGGRLILNILARSSRNILLKSQYIYISILTLTFPYPSLIESRHNGETLNELFSISVLHLLRRMSSSAQSATFLILLQISSRGFTFIVNQVLLRYLSAPLLGISQQLELFAISVLYFSRESLRVALQRQSVERTRPEDKSVSDTKNANVTSSSERLQELINLSYLPVLLGPVLATLFAWLYLTKASSESLDIPYLQLSLRLYCLAAVVELTVEPCFAFAAQKQNIRVRAAAETYATILRCVVTVASAIWDSRNGAVLGALPFAFGQCAYAMGLWGVYYGYVWKTKDEKVSILPKRLGRYVCRTISIYF